MFDLAKHTSHIDPQLEFLASHATGGNRREDVDTIAALALIAQTLRASAAVFDRERERRQYDGDRRAERLAVLMRGRDGRS